MELTYKFYFRLINVILSYVRCHVSDLGSCNEIEFISKSISYNPVITHDKIIQSDMIGLINLIVLKINVYSKWSECCTNGNSMWLVNQIDGIESLVSDLPICYALTSLIKDSTFMLTVVNYLILNNKMVTYRW